MQYLDDQRQATGSLPDDRTLVLERTRDEMGDWRLCLLSPWGGRVHAPWTIALAAWLRERGELELESIWSDDGIVLRLPERERPPEAAKLVPDPEQIEDLVVRELPGTRLFAARFREAAARALLLPRRRPGQRTPLWMRRKRAHDLLQVAAQYPSFPIVLEAARDCLSDVFDLQALVGLAALAERVGDPVSVQARAADLREHLGHRAAHAAEDVVILDASRRAAPSWNPFEPKGRAY